MRDLVIILPRRRHFRALSSIGELRGNGAIGFRADQRCENMGEVRHARRVGSCHYERERWEMRFLLFVRAMPELEECEVR